MIDANAAYLITLLESNGYEAYAVGGCVRDALLGNPCGDVDIATSALPREVEAVLAAQDIPFIETGIQHGTVTARVQHISYEITTFRKDGDYLDSRHPERVEFVDDLKEDLQRRDFTVNAMAYHADKGVIDLFGGRQDLENKILRAVGNPQERFQEDALRIMRALRFSAVLGFQIEAATQAAVFAEKERLREIANERIAAELMKLLCGKYVETVLTEYREVFAVILPELTPSFDCAQHSRWHLYDVYTHTVKSVALAPPTDYVRLAVLLHDIGKPFCKTTDENGNDHFKGHPAVSASMAQTAMRRLRLSKEVMNKVIIMIENHDYHITKKPANIKRWLRLLGDTLIFDFIDMKEADILTHDLSFAGEEAASMQEIRRLTREILDAGEPYRIADLMINGNDLKALGYCGKEIAEELERLIVIVSGDANCNTREKLLRQAAADKQK